MRNCPTCGRIWRRPTWDWASRATRWTLCSAFPSSLLARPARIRSRVRRRRDEEDEGAGERESGGAGERENGRVGERGSRRARELVRRELSFSRSLTLKKDA